MIRVYSRVVSWSESNRISVFLARFEREILLVLSMGAAAFYFFTSYLFYLSYNYGAVDTAYYQQALWLVGQFQTPESSIYPTPNVFLSGHFMPVGFVFGLLYRYFPSLILPMILHALHTSLTIYPTYWSARFVGLGRIFSITLCLIFITQYSAFPLPIHFCFENLSILYISTAIFFSLKKRYGVATIFWIIGCSFKEYFSLMLAGMGCCVCFFGGNRKWGGAWIFLGILWAYFFIFILMPSIHTSNDNLLLHFGNFGSTENEIYANLLTRADIWFNQFYNKATMRYVSGLLSPLGVLMPLLGGEFLIPIFPIFIINGLTANSWAINSAMSHYSYMMVPFLLTAAMVGIHRFDLSLSKRAPRQAFFWKAAILAVLLIQCLFGIKKNAYYFKRAIISWHIFEIHSQDVREMQSVLSEKDSIICCDKLTPYFSHRKSISAIFDEKDYLNPEKKSLHVAKADYFLWDTFDELSQSEALNKAAEAGFSVLRYDPKLYYNRGMFRSRVVKSSPAVDFFMAQGYKLKHQSGSLVLFKKELTDYS